MKKLLLATTAILALGIGSAYAREPASVPPNAPAARAALGIHQGNPYVNPVPMYEGDRYEGARAGDVDDMTTGAIPDDRTVASAESPRTSAEGAGVGAASGALIGGAAGGPLGAVIGGVSGAAIGSGAVIPVPGHR